MDNPTLDYAFLLMQQDPTRVKHVKAQHKQHPYFRIIAAIDARRDWDGVERAFIANDIKVGQSWSNPLIGKLGRWASFLEWLAWLRDANANAVAYGVLVEDDVVLPNDFRQQLDSFIEQHPERWYFRCGSYNSCLVVKREKADHVLQLIRKTQVSIPDDWWSWKAGKVLQQGPTKLVKQLVSYKSNIAGTPNYVSLNRPKNPKMWALPRTKK